MNKKIVLAMVITLLSCSVVGFITVRNAINADNEYIERTVIESVYRINTVVSRQLHITRALAALVIKGDGIVVNFDKIAPELVADVPAFVNVLLAPGGVVTYVYPLEGNESIIGLDFFNDTDHYGNKEAVLARDLNELVLAGPFLMRQGFLGIAGRYPVYINNEAGESEFWGLVSISLKFPEVLDGTGLSLLEQQGFSYEFWRINPDTQERQIMVAGGRRSEGAYIERKTTLYSGEGFFRIYREREWYQYHETWLVFLGALSVSFFIAFIMQTKYAGMYRAAKIHSELVEKIMLSQIKPHFLYNALTAVAQLCDEDPAKAKRAAIDFSSYLRGNMESLNVTSVSIEKELEHVKGYLDLEKAIYGNELNIIYNIECGGFFIPPLTIQPIVENAIRHGIGQKECGGTIEISVHKTDKEFHIVIKDDGVGYNSKNLRTDSQIGISNVMRRLKKQCGGTLKIFGEQNKGTTVIIKIPMTK
jgi:sensor domain CHASE-containing protein